MAQAPADGYVTCIEATLNRRGRFTDTAIVSSSGSNTFDRNAIQLVKDTDLSRIFPSAVQPHSGYVVVTSGPSGSMTLGFTGKLLPSCPSDTAVSEQVTAMAPNKSFKPTPLRFAV
ncbi:hypothetical protein GCM10027359_31570 [Marilutibacter aestuarii]